MEYVFFWTPYVVFLIVVTWWVLTAKSNAGWR